MASAVAESIEELEPWFRWAQVLHRYGDLEDMGARAVSSSRRFDEVSNPVYAIWHRHRFLGEVMIDNPRWATHRALELEIWIRRSATGRGFATEALEAVVDHLLEVQGCAILEARVYASNAASRKLFQRVGFAHVGHLEDHDRMLLHAEESCAAQPLGVVVLTHPACLDHQVGPTHAERPERLEAVLEGLDGLPVTLLGAPRGTGSLELAHPPAYLEHLQDQLPEDGGVVELDADTDAGPGSIDAALRGVGGVVAAVDLVLEGRATHAFVATRPPGHHAKPTQAKGFCLFATAAIGVLHALREGVRRVALIDFDVHHGDGSEAVLAGVPGVLFVSLYEEMLYPRIDLEGTAAASNTVRVPLEPHIDSEGYRRAFEEQVLPRLHAHEPELLLVSAGFDGHARDEHSSMTLGAEDYRWLTRQLCAFGPVVSVLEGGYDLVGLALSARAHVEALLE